MPIPVLRAAIIGIVSSVTGGVAWVALEPTARDRIGVWTGADEAVAAVAGPGAEFLALDVDPDARPSFDCADATTAVERLICSDASLAEADMAMSRVWRSLSDRELIDDELRLSQRAWIARRDACLIADDAHACVRGEMRERITFLSEL